MANKKGMLLNVKFEIEVTNDGKNNQLIIPVQKDVKFIEVMTALELATQTFSGAIMNYFENTGKKYTEEEAKDLLYSLTLDQIGESIMKQK